MRRRKWLWVGGIALTVLLSLWAVWHATGPRTILPEGSERVLEDWGYYEIAVSSDGGMLAYSYWPDEQPRVVLVTLATRDWRELPPGYRMPRWLPDGSLLLLREDDGAGVAALFRLAKDIEEPEFIASLEGVSSIIAAAVTPGDDEGQNGASLYLVDYDSRRRTLSRQGFWKLELGKTDLEPVTWVSCNWFNSFAVTRDGSQWALVSLGRGGSGILLYDHERALQETVPMPRPAVFVLGFSPDARFLLCARYTYAPRGRFLDSLAARTARISTAPAARTVWLEMAGIAEDASQVELLALDLQSKTLSTIAQFGEGWGLEGQWLPDGRHILASTGEGPVWRIPLPEPLWSAPAPGYTGDE